MPADRPVLVSDVPAVPPIFVNGPDEDVDLNTWYHVAPSEAVQDIKIELDDFAVAVTPVGVAGMTTALTTCEIAGLVLVPNLASPAYVAVIGCDPTDNEDVESVATLPDVVPVPMLTPLS